MEARMATFAAVMQEMMSAHDVGSGALVHRLHDVGYWGAQEDLNTTVILYMHGNKKPPAAFVEAFAEALALNEAERDWLWQSYQR
jgi:hypothetical protein